MTSSAQAVSRLFLVEDNPDDLELARVAIARLDLAVEVEFAEDGAQAFERLQALASLDASGSGTLPNVVLLDLSMPGISGIELLSKIRSDGRLSRLPVVIFTTSTAERDIRASYEAGCNAFVVKPYSMGELCKVLDRVIGFWCTCVRYPVSR